VHAPAAAGSVLEFGGVVHSWGRFCSFILWNVFAFAFVFASRQAAIGCLAAVSALIPMAQMKPNSSRPTAVMIFLWSLACRGQPQVALVQPVLRLPGDLFDLFRHSLLPSAQPRPDAWPEPVAPGRFNDDSSQMRVARFGDAPAPRSLAAGVLAGHRAAVAH
jgi:hypothetical protein